MIWLALEMCLFTEQRKIEYIYNKDYWFDRENNHLYEDFAQNKFLHLLFEIPQVFDHRVKRP